MRDKLLRLFFFSTHGFEAQNTVLIQLLYAITLSNRFMQILKLFVFSHHGEEK